MQIVLIQSRARREHALREHANFMRAIGHHHSVASISTLDESQPWSDPALFMLGKDAVIFGGSGDFDLDGGRDDHDPAKRTSQVILERITPLVEYLLATDSPTLGVCYGHQLIAEIMGGNVTHDHSQMKLGSHDVVHFGDDPLFKDIPEVFTAQYGHKDSVTTLPKAATLIAKGDTCEYSALRYGKRIYTTQFHPELTAEDFRDRLEGMTDYLPGRVVSKDCVRESPHASTIIARFIEHI